MDSNSLSLEEKIKRIKDPYNTKILSAIILCNYKPQLEFWGSEGKFAKEIAKVFPNEGNLDLNELEFGINPKVVKISHPKAFTQCVLGITEASLRIEDIIPGTFNYFISYAENFLDALSKDELFGDSFSSLVRFGIRVQLLNQIKESNVDIARRNLLTNITNINSLNSIFKPQAFLPHSLSLEPQNFNLNQRFVGTLTRGNKILNYKTNIGIVFGDNEIIKRMTSLSLSEFESEKTCILTDVDLFIFNCTISEAKQLCKHSNDLAPQIHADLIKELKI